MIKLFGALAVAAFTMLAPVAHADEGTYVRDLAAADIPVTPVTLPLGHVVCSELSVNGPKGLDVVVQSALRENVDHHQIAGIVVFAVWELCPSNTAALNAWEAKH